MKKCYKCKQLKENVEFYKDRAKHNGLKSYCKMCEKKCREEYREKYHHSVHGKYTTYKYAAKKRNHLFNLSETEFALLVSSPCYYCDELQENFNGIDRVDNSKGYIIENCVSCCEACNKMKLTHTKEEFIMKCKQVLDKQEVMSYRS